MSMACRQNFHYLFPQILFIVSQLMIVRAIQCYNGTETKPSKQEIFHGLPDSLKLTQCSNKLCFNFFETATNVHATFACDSDNNCNGKAGCTEVTYQNKTGIMCCCNKDNCNINSALDTEVESKKAKTASLTSQPHLHFTTPNSTSARTTCVTGSSNSWLKFQNCQSRVENCIYVNKTVDGKSPDKFGCDLKNICSKYNVKNSCKEINKLKICCCDQDNCNTAEFAKVKMPPVKPVHKCFSGIHSANEHKNLLLISCSNDSAFCVNSTTTYSPNNITVEYFCDRNHVCPLDGCYIDRTTDPARKVCCCSNSSCNSPNSTLELKEASKSRIIHTAVFISLMTFASFVTIAIVVVVYRLCKKRKPVYDPVQVTYQRLTMDLSA